MKILKTDLSAITGKSPMFTTVEIEEKLAVRNLTWLICGETSLSVRSDRRWTLSSYLRKMTDYDHDAAYAFRFTLVGVEFEFMSGGTSHFSGWIEANEDPKDGDQYGEFRVPKNGEYDPARMDGVKKCDRCKGEDKHLFVPEGFYLPPFDAELYEAVKGKRVRITTGMR